MNDATEELACYCMNATPADIRALAVSSGIKSFGQFCEHTGLGMQCTSCLLQLEPAFLAALHQNEKAGSPTAGTVRSGADAVRKPFKVRLAEYLSRVGPKIPSPRYTNLPVLRGQGVSTVLCVSDVYIVSSKVRPSDYVGRIFVFDRHGNCVEKRRISIRSGEYFEIDLSSFIPVAETGYSYGSARLDFHATSDRPTGFIRPHFRLLTPNSAAAVHCLPTSRESAFHTFMVGPPGTVTMFHLQNGVSHDNSAKLRIVDDATNREIVAEAMTLPPHGSHLFAFTPEMLPKDAAGALLRFECSVAAWVRGFIIVADAKGRLVADHI